MVSRIDDSSAGSRSPQASAAAEEAAADEFSDPPLVIGPYLLRSRLIVGTGRYDDFDVMRRAVELSGADCVTVAVRRERQHDRRGRNILDFLDPERVRLLPNTAGCYTARDAVRVARMGREILRQLDPTVADWVKLEALGDARTLLPDPVETLAAAKELVAEGFHVLCYTSDDPVVARRLKEIGVAAVMPAGSPIGSGQGILNPNNLRIILEYLKADDPSYPVIVDAGVGAASDVASAMELGVDGVLLNTAIAHARDPLRMARAMRLAAIAGRDSYLAGRIPKRLYASASSPAAGVIASKPYLQ